MPGPARRAPLPAALWASPLLALAALLVSGPAAALAAAGGGSSSFGGGGGGFSGGGFTGGGGGSGTGEAGLGGTILTILLLGGFVLLMLIAVVASIRYGRRRRRRREAVERASLAAAEDDAAFHRDVVREQAERLFREAQAAWDARDRERLAGIVGDELLVEWQRRLDDFERKGWHNRVEVVGPIQVEYVGLVNRAADADDRAVVRISANIRDYVVARNGRVITAKGKSSKTRLLQEWWTLAKRDGRWIVASIEQEAEGRHHLSSEIVATPADDVARLSDEALVGLAAEDKVADGFSVAEVADLDFDGDAHAAALDLSLADARFAPNVLEAAARRAVGAWAEAVDGDDAPLEAVAAPEAVRRLLHPEGERSRVVVRGPAVERLRIVALDAAAQPPRMTIELAVRGRRYLEDRDTAAVLAGSREAETRFTERWTLLLDGPEEAPWRIVEVAAQALR